MSNLAYRVISIGSLSHHPLWPDPQPQRTAHATTTLIRSGDRLILVDPALPDPILPARLAERAGLPCQAVTDVFLTNFRPAHRRGLPLFEHAKWWISHAEREFTGLHLLQQFEQADDPQLKALLQSEIQLLKRCEAAPDQLAPQVDLFPLPGFTPGTTGLLLPIPAATILIASDAVPTCEHLDAGQVLAGSHNIEQARESFTEAVEIADWIITGHDNLIPNMTRRMF